MKPHVTVLPTETPECVLVTTSNGKPLLFTRCLEDERQSAEQFDLHRLINVVRSLNSFHTSSLVQLQLHGRRVLALHGERCIVIVTSRGITTGHGALGDWAQKLMQVQHTLDSLYCDLLDDIVRSELLQQEQRLESFTVHDQLDEGKHVDPETLPPFMRARDIYVKPLFEAGPCSSAWLHSLSHHAATGVISGVYLYSSHTADTYTLMGTPQQIDSAENSASTSNSEMPREWCSVVKEAQSMCVKGHLPNRDDGDIAVSKKLSNGVSARLVRTTVMRRPACLVVMYNHDWVNGDPLKDGAGVGGDAAQSPHALFTAINTTASNIAAAYPAKLVRLPDLLSATATSVSTNGWRLSEPRGGWTAVTPTRHLHSPMAQLDDIRTPASPVPKLSLHSIGGYTATATPFGQYADNSRSASSPFTAPQPPVSRALFGPDTPHQFVSSRRSSETLSVEIGHSAQHPPVTSPHHQRRGSARRFVRRASRAVLPTLAGGEQRREMLGSRGVTGELIPHPPESNADGNGPPHHSQSTPQVMRRSVSFTTPVATRDDTSVTTHDDTTNGGVDNDRDITVFSLAMETPRSSLLPPLHSPYIRSIAATPSRPSFTLTTTTTTTSTRTPTPPIM